MQLKPSQFLKLFLIVKVNPILQKGFPESQCLLNSVSRKTHTGNINNGYLFHLDVWKTVSLSPLPFNLYTLQKMAISTNNLFAVCCVKRDRGWVVYLLWPHVSHTPDMRPHAPQHAPLSSALLKGGFEVKKKSFSCFVVLCFFAAFNLTRVQVKEGCL